MPEFKVWRGMLGRCSGDHNDNYGARGIKVCERWQTFAAFVEDMGPRPSPDHSIERVDVNGHYEPSNCKWATSTEQNRNRRNVPLVTFQGRTMCRTAWAEELGIKVTTLVRRLRRMPLHEALRAA